jgi:hypothetical protein
MSDAKENLFKQLRSIDMANAKEELLSTLERAKSSIKCATLTVGREYWEEATKNIINLKEGYSKKEYEEFLNRLDFEYDNGYGGQELYGIVWLMEENTWLERGEYDGSEWWEYNKCPKIPERLKREDNHYMSTL